MSMSQNTGDESFIILGTSPGTSLDAQCNQLLNGGPLNKEQLEDALKDMSLEASQAFKAHFQLGDAPSLPNMMAASMLVTDDKSIVELQKKFGELLDENTILRETLQKNNESMQHQLQVLATCQQDMLRTHQLHQHKFHETRHLVERLRQDNKQLKLDIARLANGDDTRDNSSLKPQSNPDSIKTNSQTNSGTKLNTVPNSQNSVSSLKASDEARLASVVCDDDRSGPSSGMEFVTSPDDDTINKLTQQLELVEKQRRQLIVENEKLSWQKESLEHIVDHTTKERDNLRDSLKHVELQLSTTDSDWQYEVNKLKNTIQELQTELMVASTTKESSAQDSLRNAALTTRLEERLAALQADLQTSQLRVLQLETVKLEFSRYKSSSSETVRTLRGQLQELHDRLKLAQTLVLPPTPGRAADSSLQNNMKVYNAALKHLADYLNSMANSTSDSLACCMSLMSELTEAAPDGKTPDGTPDSTPYRKLRSSLQRLRQALDDQHKHLLTNMGQIKNSLSIFQGIFKDCQELLEKQNNTASVSAADVSSAGVLSAALISREQELKALKLQLQQAADSKDECQLLRAQLEVYKSDFEAERESRAELAAARDSARAELARANTALHTLQQQLQAGRAAPKPNTHTAKGTTSDTVYTCPKCLRFSSAQYKLMEEHFDFCLDDF